MKGTISLNRLNPENPDQIYFCKLDGGTFGEADLFAVADVSHNESIERAGVLVAHDTVEHTIAHRRNRTVSAEEELRALGAILFVRPTQEVIYDIAMQFNYVNGRDIEDVPVQFRNLDTKVELDELEEALQREDIYKSAADIERGLRNVNYGYWAKAKQFGGEQTAAAIAFNLIESYVPTVLKDLRCSDPYEATGATISFDSKRMQVSHRMRRQPMYY